VTAEKHPFMTVTVHFALSENAHYSQKCPRFMLLHTWSSGLCRSERPKNALKCPVERGETCLNRDA